MSVLSQLDDRYEVVVVDGGSTDGTQEVVEQLRESRYNLKVISRRCSRGAGRDQAYRIAKGRYLIQQVDSDVVYLPTLQTTLNYYHSKEKTYGGLYAIYVEGAYLICARDLMERIGGWPDLQFAEDLYVYAKLAGICNFEYNRALTGTTVREHVKTGRRIRAVWVLVKGGYSDYVIWRDMHRVLTFQEATRLLRLYVAWAAKDFPRKFGHALMFIAGWAMQFANTRYKIHGADLQYYTKVILRYYFWEEEDLRRE